MVVCKQQLNRNIPYRTNPSASQLRYICRHVDGSIASQIVEVGWSCLGLSRLWLEGGRVTFLRRRSNVGFVMMTHVCKVNCSDDTVCDESCCSRFRPKKFTLKNYKRLFFVFKDTHLSMFRSREETNVAPILRINLVGKTHSVLHLVKYFSVCQL